MIPPFFLFPSFYWKPQIGRPNSDGFQDLQFPFLSMFSKWLPLTPCCFEEIPFYLMKCLSFHFCPEMHKTCQAWGAPGELRGGRLKLHKIKLFYARLVLSSTLEFALAVVQRLPDRAFVRSGGEEEQLHPCVMWELPGLGLTGLASLGCAQDNCGSLRFHWEEPGKEGKEKSGILHHPVAVTYPETEIPTEVCQNLDADTEFNWMWLCRNS